MPSLPLRVTWSLPTDEPPLPTARAPSPPAAHAHLSLRTRRAVAQLTALVFLLGVVGLWSAGGPAGAWERVRVGRLGESAAAVRAGGGGGAVHGVHGGAQGAEGAEAAPGKLVGSGGTWGWDEDAAAVGSAEDGQGEEDGVVGGAGGARLQVVAGSEDAGAGADAADDDGARPPDPGLTPPPDPLAAWGVHSPRSSQFTGGLAPWPPNPPHAAEPLSSLGFFADDIYKQGPGTLDGLRAQLEQAVDVAFPPRLQPAMRAGVARYLGAGEAEAWDADRHVWQTDKLGEHRESSEVATWRGALAHGWEWTLMSDSDADAWISKTFGGEGTNHILELWRNLPSGILRSDTLRYLFLLVEGGIYTDTDTKLLKAPERWGGGARLYKGGDGWLTPTQRARLAGGEDAEAVLGRPAVVVGLEADVGEREDWFDWWPRPIQVVQWTMASAPAHPIALGAVLRILHSTADAADWAANRWAEARAMRAEGRHEDAAALEAMSVMRDPKEGGPVGVMAWTGPGVWTDAVLTYLRTKYGVQWTELRGLRQPLRIGDVVVLPVTGFSPGVGNFGAGMWTDAQAMVQHNFRGSWKD